MIGFFFMGLFSSEFEFGGKSKPPNMANSDTNVRMRFPNVRIRMLNNRFGCEIRNPNEVEMGL